MTNCSWNLLIGFCLTVLIPNTVYAQFENVWAFGVNAGVDFSAPTPTAIQTAIATREGCASICDTAGQLLFYTDGTSVWDRNDSLMLNGANLTGVNTNITESTAQGALIVPVPGESQKYYIFSMGHLYRNVSSSPNYGHLYYSIVDVNLNGGLGAVISSGTLLDTLLTEHMTAVTGDDCNVWLLVLSRLDTTDADSVNVNLKAYNITFNGIDPNPVISPTLGKSGLFGCIIISPNRSMLAKADRGLTLYDFDPAAGVISNPLVLDSGTAYGIAFSPDNSKLYSGGAAGPILQFDLSSNNPSDIIGSKTPVYGGPIFYPAIKLGPDGKLYTAIRDEADYLHVIHKPNLTGLACDFERYGFSLYPGSHSRLGLPNAATIITEVNIYNSEDSNVYEVICADSLWLSASDSMGMNYVWDDGSSGPQREVTTSGLYWVRYELVHPCLKIYVTDSFRVHFHETEYQIAFESDTLACVDEVLSFANSSSTIYNNFEWSMGNGDRFSSSSFDYSYPFAGRYTVTLTGDINGKCSDTAYKVVMIDSLGGSGFELEPKEVCLGKPVYFYPEMDHTMAGVQWTFGTQVLRSDEELGSQYEHVFDESGVYQVTLQAQFRACPDASYTDSIRVYPLPVVDLGGDMSICLDGAPVYLKNLRGAPLDPYHQVWSTGDTTVILKVVHPGVYTLSVTTEPLGCTTTESIEIRKDCYIDIPNAFTPNGDGHNDYFLPRQLLSENVNRFHMQVFNRWGQTVFETERVDGRGWDGRLNDKEQPIGVYLYRIEMDFTNGRQEQYEGNVTLMR